MTRGTGLSPFSIRPRGRGTARLTGVLSALSALALGVALVATVAPASADQVGTVQRVPGTFELSAAACVTGTTTCLAVGVSNGAPAVVVPITGGVPGPAVDVPGVDILNAITCASSTACVAVGGVTSTAPDESVGVSVAITVGADGTPTVGTTTTVTGTVTLDDVVCPTATNCVAVGAAGTLDSPLGVVVDLSAGGSPSTMQTVAGNDRAVRCVMRRSGGMYRRGVRGGSGGPCRWCRQPRYGRGCHGQVKFMRR